ncbi:SidA/IucD/PvdA family monooxygenase [Alteribacillus sp. HJP-4]|uniref:SidA/IucD/PvdA family monooxygenase n=1 Tax=Alteribacillus sp. HJP-4 TaxID=2775394 RepID=UPI0035CCD5C2
MNENTEEIYDLIGIGFGPAGIALGVAIEDYEEKLEDERPLRKLFIERSKDSTWQSDMLLEKAHIQHHFFRDFATPYNPRSKFTFANYLQNKGRLFEFGLLDLTPGRIEWNDYISWVAEQLEGSVRYNQNVLRVEPLKNTDGTVDYVEVITEDKISKEKNKLTAKNLAINSGRMPFVPDMFRPFMGKKVFHSSCFKTKLQHFKKEDTPTFAVIGSGQNAAEIILELSNRFPNSHIYSVHRNLGFKTYDLGQFSNEVYHPEFVDYFYNLSKEERQKLFDDQMKATNYSAIGPHTSTDLYWKVYEQNILGEEKIHLLRCQKIQDMKKNNEKYQIELKDIYHDKEKMINVDGVIVCTGFTEEKIPPSLNNILSYLELEEDGDISISRDYNIRTASNFNVGLYANGITERTHGISDATSFSMMALKAKKMFDDLNKKKTLELETV